MVAGSHPIKVPHTHAMLYSLNGGIGFVVGKRLLPYLQTSRVISDRVAVISFRFGKPDPPISVAIAYGPTSPRCTANPQLREDFYQQLQAAVDTIPKREVTVLMGDMNAKVGKRCSTDTYSCLGAWSKGHRNDNGEAFLEFCDQSDLIITNSLFQHASRHITTWQGYIRGLGEHESIPIYNQIDYITVSQRYKTSVKDARSWAGCTLPSDHRLVTMDLLAPKQHWYRQRDNRNPTIDTDSLVQYKDLQKEFAESVSLKLPAMPPKKSSWNEFGAVLQEIAKKKIGLRSHRGHRRRNAMAMEDPEVKMLVEEIRKLGIDENAARTRSQKAAVRIELRERRRELSTVLKRKGRKDLEKRVAEVEALKNEGRKMFAALRALNIRPANELSIVDMDGRVVHSLNSQIDILTSHFKSQFAPDGVDNLTQHQGTLQYPISQMEVVTAAAKLQNRRACGPDSVPNELLKYACTSETTSQWIADLLNAAVEGSIQLSALGTGTLVALQKPNKPRGPLTSLRPVVLLNGIRKILSLILLERFSPYADSYIPASQAGFRKGRSCTDIIFAKRLLCSTAIMYDLDVHFLCLDLSKAFDTPTRDLILKSIQLASDNHGDIMQIATTLLSNTKLSVCIKDVMGKPFESNVGVPQGDSFSPVAFTAAFEMVLQQIHLRFPATPTADVQLGLPMEMQYADDTDFISTSHDFLEDVMNVLDIELPPRHLVCNTDKTQRVHVYREGQDWQKNKTLGALLGEEQDVTRRMQLAGLAFRRMFGLFAGVSASLELKIRVWNALVRPVLLYSCGTWGLTATLTEKLCALHRRHLRILAGYRWPKRISNEALYRLTKSQPLSIDIQQSRLRLLGHCLRMPTDTPAQMALSVTVNTNLKGRRGRPPKCLLSTLRTDMDKVGVNMRNMKGLEELRNHAEDKHQWEETIEHICSA